MSDLDEKEQKHVRIALRLLRLRLGGMAVVAKALRFQYDTIDKVTRGVRPVTASMALRVARLADVSMEDLLAGKLAPAGTCPHCGRPPDFADDPTLVEDGPRPEPGGGLKLVK